MKTMTSWLVTLLTLPFTFVLVFLSLPVLILAGKQKQDLDAYY